MDILNHISKAGNLSQTTVHIIIFDMVVKYCQLVESFIAFIEAFEESNNTSGTTNIVFNQLVNNKGVIILKDYNYFVEHGR